MWPWTTKPVIRVHYFFTFIFIQHLKAEKKLSIDVCYDRTIFAEMQKIQILRKSYLKLSKWSSSFGQLISTYIHLDNKIYQTISFDIFMVVYNIYKISSWDMIFKPGSHYRSFSPDFPLPRIRGKILLSTSIGPDVRCGFSGKMRRGVHRSNLAPTDLLAHKSGSPRSYQTCLIFRI